MEVKTKINKLSSQCSHALFRLVEPLHLEYLFGHAHGLRHTRLHQGGRSYCLLLERPWKETTVLKSSDRRPPVNSDRYEPSSYYRIVSLMSMAFHMAVNSFIVETRPCYRMAKLPFDQICSMAL